MPKCNSLQYSSGSRTFLSVLLVIQFILSFFHSTNVLAILAGEQVDWNRNGFLVKVLARERHGKNVKNVKSCTGTLISASLVLTSGQCVVDEATKERMENFVVLMAAPNQRQEFRSTARLLERSEDGVWAMLRIPPQNITELCPPDPAPKWVAHLNFRPSLTEPVRIVKQLNFDGASSGILHAEGGISAGCYMLGFETTQNPDDFLGQRNVFRLFVKLSPPNSDNNDDGLNHYRSRTSGNFTACYDDGGIPLMCDLMSQDAWGERLKPAIQLGMFQALTVPGGGAAVADGSSSSSEKKNNSNSTNWSLETCRKAREMRFSLFHEDPALARAIERHAFAEFVKLYQACGFSSP